MLVTSKKSLRAKQSCWNWSPLLKIASEKREKKTIIELRKTESIFVLYLTCAIYFTMFFTWSFFAWKLSFHNKNVWKKRFLVSICLYLQNFTREYMTGKSLQLKMQSLFAKTATIFKNFSSIFSRYCSDWPAQKRLLSFLPPLSQTPIKEQLSVILTFFFIF